MNPRRIAISTLLAVGLLTLGAGAARAQDSFAAGVHIGPSGHTSVDLGFFHNSLAPYGRWVDAPAYGEVFVPRGLSAGWRPYTRGHWVYTDYGWTWVSSERFGWATYHYGRWAYDPDYGWIWVPGTQWGPAWVDWQEGDNYVGWAPLPPTVGFDASYGVGSVQIGVDLAPAAFVFVPERRFLVADVASYCLPAQENVTIIGRTRNITRYSVVNDRVFNQGLPIDQVERFAGRRVPRYQVADLRTFDSRPRIQGGRLGIFRPAVMAAGNVRTAERIAAESRRGNAAVRQQVRRGIEAQTTALQGRRFETRANQQQAAGRQVRAQRQQIAARAQAQRGNQRVRAQQQRQQIAARAQEQRGNQRVRAREQRQQIAARAQQQRNNQRIRAQQQRQQIATRNQAQRSNERSRAQAAAQRGQQRAQANAERRRERQQPPQQQARRQNRPPAQPARAQQRPPAQRQQVAQQRQHGRPPQGSGQPDQRRGHGGF